MARPLVCSSRAEMLPGNLQQVNLFTVDLAKEQNFQFIYIVDKDCTIILPTDKISKK